jgi:hypothetical protein
MPVRRIGAWFPAMSFGMAKRAEWPIRGMTANGFAQDK